MGSSWRLNFVSGEFRPHRYPLGCWPTGCLWGRNSQELKVKLQEASGVAYQSNESYNQESLYSIKRFMIPTRRVLHSIKRALSMKRAPTFYEKSQHSTKRVYLVSKEQHSIKRATCYQNVVTHNTQNVTGNSKCHFDITCT